MSALPAALAAGPRYFGVYPAVVEAVDEGGTVSLRMEWFNPTDPVEKCRVAHLYAGNGYGTFFVPEVGDEVLVAFAFGDAHQPVVIGGMYNGVDAAATDRSGNKDEKLIRTKAGHEIRLIDTPDGEKVVVRELSGEASLELVTEGAVVTLRGKDVTIQAEGKLVLSGQTVEVKATGGEVKVTGNPIKLN